jgi:predicted transcriptional regulator of viral defense system
MCPVSHPTALLRSGAAFVETEVMDGTGAGPLRVSTLERTFVDLLERPRLTGAWPEVLRVVGTFPELDLDRVVCYVRCLDNATTAAKAGWILERCERQFGTTRTVLHRLEALRPRGPHYLSRTDRESGRYLARWRLVVPATL